MNTSRRAFGLGVSAILLSGCAIGPGSRPPRSAAEELARRSADLRRPMQQAAFAKSLGDAGAYAVGGPAFGIAGAIPVVVSTGTYVGYLSQQFDGDASQYARLKSDMALTREESQAAIRSMREAIAQEVQTPTKIRTEIDAAAAGLNGRIGELRAAVAQYAPQSPELLRGLEQLETDRREMLDLAAQTGGPSR